MGDSEVRTPEDARDSNTPCAHREVLDTATYAAAEGIGSSAS